MGFKLDHFIESRAPFLALQPIGLASPSLESFSSYISRFAVLNGFMPGQLVFRRVQPGDPRPEIFPRRISVRGSEFLGFQLSHFVLNRAADLSDNAPVRSLSWLSRIAGVSFYKIFSRTARWCPHCLASDKIPYFRVTWALQMVEACALHRTQLASQCTCGSIVEHFEPRTPIGICARCHRLLAHLDTIPAKHQTAEVANALGQMVAHLSSADETIDGAAIVRGLIEFVDPEHSMTAAHQARRLQVPKATLHYWINRNSAPNFGRLVDICLQNGIDLCSALSGSPQLGFEFLHRNARTGKRSIAPAERHKMLSAARGELRNPSPRSLTAVAQKLGVDRKTLQYWDPELAEQISLRAIKAKREVAADRWQRFEKQVTKNYSQCIQQKTRVTMRRLRHGIAPSDLIPMKNRMFIRTLCQSLTATGYSRA